MTSKYGKYGFWLYVPKDIANKKMPLVIFLHGSGECGNNLDNLTSVALPKTLKNGYQYNAIIAAPQNPKLVAWKHRVSVVKDLIDYISKNYNIDPDRISITGHSSGAIGAYNFAAKYPNLLSCIAPVSGYASTDIANIASGKRFVQITQQEPCHLRKSLIISVL
jgi:predicted peptidase